MHCIIHWQIIGFPFTSKPLTIFSSFQVFLPESWLIPCQSWTSDESADSSPPTPSLLLPGGLDQRWKCEGRRWWSDAQQMMQVLLRTICNWLQGNHYLLFCHRTRKILYKYSREKKQKETKKKIFFFALITKCGTLKKKQFNTYVKWLWYIERSEAELQYFICCSDK